MALAWFRRVSFGKPNANAVPYYQQYQLRLFGKFVRERRTK